MIERIVVGKFAVNCFFVMCDETKEAVIIDPGAQANVIDRQVKKHEAKVKYIVLTHGHGDHIGAVEELKALYNVPVIASEDEDDMLQNPDFNESSRICDHAISFTADQYVRDEDELTFGNKTMKFIMTPGHTKGGMCIHIDDHLFTGDTLFNRSVGRTDLYGGSHQTLISSIAFKLLRLDDETKVYPGHGAMSTIGFEREHNPFM
ncbi:MBL fold metallo-hydrolase [Acidaminobacter sp. JC074]|uniref:MBL fold metallo-hydrolase n=1 Tax=Acidaminobacter sp. JC074 TaxID=2530199 RepID=UPI001F0E4CCE|nr:MBL fold metallo-hydrolase [Acidaminobacter sp. JC074]